MKGDMMGRMILQKQTKRTKRTGQTDWWINGLVDWWLDGWVDGVMRRAHEALWEEGDEAVRGE